MKTKILISTMPMSIFYNADLNFFASFLKWNLNPPLIVAIPNITKHSREVATIAYHMD